MTKTPDGQWSYGELPDKLGIQIFEQLHENNKTRSLTSVQCDLDDYEKYAKTYGRDDAKESEKDDGRDR